MKKTTKMMSLVFVLTLLFAAVCFNASAFTADEVTYEIKNNEVYITAVNADITEDIVIPDIIEDLPVVAICEGVFENCVQIKTITLPATLKIIEENAFGGCTEIETIYFEGTEEAWVEGIYELPETTNRITVHYNSQDHEHIWQEEITPATCTSKGFTKNYCECGEYYYSDYIEASGEHSYITNTTPATTTSDGVIETTCENCDDYYDEQIIAKIKSVTLSTSECVYNGKVRTPSVKVKDENGKTLVLETDYTVSYADGRKTPGRYAIYANFQGNYSGKVKLVFTILPKAATSLKATQSTSVVKLTWGKVTGATGYRVYQYSPSKDTYVQKASIKGTNTYRVTGLKAGTTYKFKIRAYTKTSSGVVLWAEDSKVITTATEPVAPTTFFTSETATVIKLTWRRVTDETGYRVYQYSPSKKKYVQIASVKHNGYKKKDLKAGTTYKFKVKPYVKLADGTVIWGTASSAFTTTTNPAKVTNVKATTTPFTIKLTWSKVTGATGYKVYLYNASNKKYEEFDKTTKTSYSATFAHPNTTYKFKVKAYKILSDKTYEGDASDACAAKTKTATVAERESQLKKYIKKFGVENAQGNYVWATEYKDGKHYNLWGLVNNEKTGKIDYIFYSAPLYLDGHEDAIQFSVTNSTTSTIVNAVTVTYKNGSAIESASATATLKPKNFTAKTVLDFKFDSNSSSSLKNQDTEDYFNYLLQWSFEVWDDMVRHAVGTGLSGVGFTAYK